MPANTICCSVASNREKIILNETQGRRVTTEAKQYSGNTSKVIINICNIDNSISREE